MTSQHKYILLISLLTILITSIQAQSSSSTPPTVTHSTVVRPYGWVIALIVLASLGILVVIGLEIGILCQLYATRNCRATWLGQLLVFAAFCSYLTMYAFLPFPCFTTCGIIRFCVGVCYAMLFAVAFVKLVAILCHDKHLGLCVVLFFFVWGVQVVIDIQWLIRDVSVVRYINNTDGVICDPGYTQHVQSLIYNMFLICSCLVLAVVAQCRTETTTDRVVSLLIGLASLAVIAVWIAWILLGFLINNSEWHDPCIAFGLLITTTIMLAFLMPPKFHALTKRRQSTFKQSNGGRGQARLNDGYIPEFTAEIPNAIYNKQSEDQISVEFQHPALADDDDVDRTLERGGGGDGGRMRVGEDRVIYSTSNVKNVRGDNSEYMNTAEMRRNDPALQNLPTLTKVNHHQPYGSVSSYNDKRATHSGRVTPVSMGSRQGTYPPKQGSVVYVVN